MAHHGVFAGCTLDIEVSFDGPFRFLEELVFGGDAPVVLVEWSESVAVDEVRLIEERVDHDFACRFPDDEMVADFADGIGCGAVPGKA